MAKGAKRKTKWVSLSLASANTTTSVATGSDSEQLHQQHGAAGGMAGHRQKLFSASTTKHNGVGGGKESLGSGDSAEEQHSNEPLDALSGNRTDTSGHSSSSDCFKGPGDSLSERRSGGPGYHRRRPPPYHARTSWNGGTAGGRGSYGAGGSRSSYYNGGGGGYYTGRRSQYDSGHHQTRRPAVYASGANKTTSGEGGGGGGDGGGATINDDEYTRITTPRQDVLFKKGYLSRPKAPATGTATNASTSNENTASSSIAGTTSEGSDGGNGGGSNSISTTESITSEYGGSYAADGSPLFDYPYPFLPCGYFTENGVLVMNGFAVDNNGYSYFNGGQTYIYPPNFSSCQQQPPAADATGAMAEGGGVEPSTDTMHYPANDETIANNPEDQPTGYVPEPEDKRIVAAAECSSSDRVSSDTSRVEEEVVVMVEENGPTAAEQCEGTGAVQQSVPEAIGQAGNVVDPMDPNAATVVVPDVDVSGDYDNGFYQFHDGYDFAQFYSSIYYPNIFMDQCRLYEDAAGPLYGAGEYAMPNGDVYTHQTSFKRRKKRFRTFEEMPAENGISYDVTDTSGTLMCEGKAETEAVSTALPATGETIQLNVDVKEFHPAGTPVPLPVPSQEGATVSSGTDGVLSQTHDHKHSCRDPKKLPPAGAKVGVKTTGSSKTPLAGAAGEATTRPTAASHRIRKRDLIESTLAFAEQNIDLTRPKGLAVGGSASHESELECWTTIDRNGRKKRLEQPEKRTERTAPSSPSTGREKQQQQPRESAAEQRPPVEPVEPVHPPTTAVEASAEAAHPSSSQSTLDSNASMSDSAKRQQAQPMGKSKKKTKTNKRQPHRKAGGGLHKHQKHEGFQLIEPEFPSVQRRPRDRNLSGKDGQLQQEPELECSDEEEEQQQQQHLEDSERVQEDLPEQADVPKETDILPDVAPALKSEEDGYTVEGPKERATSEKLNCDKSNEISLVAEGRQENAQDLVVAAPTEVLPSPESQVNPENQEEEEEEEEVLVTKENETEQEQAQSASECEVSASDNEGVPTLEEQPTAVAEDLVPAEEEKLDGPQLAVVEDPVLDVSADRNVLTSAAKQLSLSERPPRPQLLGAKGDSSSMVDEGDGDAGSGSSGAGSEDEFRGKRGSVSGAGYTESIDSGLQSPAPCGGVSSPEASSMASSIESNEAPMGEAQSEVQLSQIVGKWLLRKLEVHEPEEVFVLPSDPLLMQRLERFQRLQRRGRAQRELGDFSSESDDDGVEDLDDGSLEDSDGDYMTDGLPGRVDLNASDETIHSTPANTLEENDASFDHQLNAKACRTLAPDEEEAATVKLHHVLSTSDSHSINSQAGALREAASASAATESKRCVIM